MAKQEAIALVDFQAKYGDEEACREHLFTIRWPQGYVCPKCGYKEYSFHSKRKLYQCKRCRHQVSVTAGTVMHKTRTPLVKWFWGVYLAGRDKRGISALRLQAELGVCYMTAWTMLHKIRKAMGERDAEYQLAGLVEVDDSYFGGPKSGGKRGRGTEKTEVIVGVSLDGDKKPRYVKMEIGENLKSETLVSFAERHIAEGARISSDAYNSYLKAFSGSTYTHEPKKFDQDDKEHLRWLHTFVSNAKTFILGTYHGLDGTHFQAYLDEFCYRANRRGFAGELFDRLLCACASTAAITYKMLVARPAEVSG